MMKTVKISSVVAETSFNINETFSRHGWKGEMSLKDAETALNGKAPFTYLTRFSEQKDKFTLSFVQADGSIKHDIFVLVDWKEGIFANGGPCHRGPLDILVLLKMNCRADQARPL